MDAKNIGNKIQELKRQGFSPKEAADMIGIDLDASVLASWAQEEKEVSIDELLEQGKLNAVKLLNQIIEDPTCEDKDRINAAKIVLTGSGELPKLSGYNEWEERIRRMKIACGEIIDVDTGSKQLLEMAS